MAFGLQTEIDVAGAISAGLSWSFVRTEDRPRGESVGKPGSLANLPAVGDVVPLSHASSQAELGLLAAVGLTLGHRCG